MNDDYINVISIVCLQQRQLALVSVTKAILSNQFELFHRHNPNCSEQMNDIIEKIATDTNLFGKINEKEEEQGTLAIIDYFVCCFKIKGNLTT